MSQPRISRRAALKLSVYSGLGLTLPASFFLGMRNQARGDAGPTDRDYAITVGIQNYPNLVSQIGQGALQGPVSDARAFHKWVTSPTGAAVPPANAHLFDQPCQQCLASTANACPSRACIEHELDSYWDIAQENASHMLGEKIGRRLYLYLAGHGIEPQNGGPALLAADAGVGRFVRHIPGRRYADWFHQAGYFDEIVLFMDCCRDNTWTTPSCPLIFDPKFGNINGLKYFYAFATKWNRRSRERSFGAETRGIFTTALLEGLSGAASDPDTGAITAASLQEYLHQSIGEFLGPDLAALPAEEVEADILREPQSGDGFVICKAKPKLYPVTLQLSPAAMGKVIQILTSGKNGFVERYRGQPAAATEPLLLPRGLYIAQVVGAMNPPKNFQVPKDPAVSL